MPAPEKAMLGFWHVHARGRCSTPRSLLLSQGLELLERSAAGEEVTAYHLEAGCFTAWTFEGAAAGHLSRGRAREPDHLALLSHIRARWFCDSFGTATTTSTHIIPKDDAPS